MNNFPPRNNNSSNNNNSFNRDRRNYTPRNQREEAHNINERIRAPKVRVVGDNIESKVVNLNEALQMAKELNLDLVEINPNSEPPICRIVDYSKFKYEQKKKQKELKSKTHKVILKEIRFGPNTDDHDFDFKLKHAINFIKEGNKVKAYVHFVGRQIAYKEQGEKLLLRFAQALEEVAKADDLPKLEGKRMMIFFSPKSQKK